MDKIIPQVYALQLSIKDNKKKELVIPDILCKIEYKEEFSVLYTVICGDKGLYFNIN